MGSMRPAGSSSRTAIAISSIAHVASMTGQTYAGIGEIPRGFQEMHAEQATTATDG